MYKGIQSARLTRRRRHRRMRTYVCVPAPTHESSRVLAPQTCAIRFAGEQAAARLAFDGCRADPTSLLSQIRKYASYCIVG